MVGLIGLMLTWYLGKPKAVVVCPINFRRTCLSILLLLILHAAQRHHVVVIPLSTISFFLVFLYCLTKCCSVVLAIISIASGISKVVCLLGDIEIECVLLSGPCCATPLPHPNIPASSNTPHSCYNSLPFSPSPSNSISQKCRSP